MSVRVRRAEPRDKARWAELWQGYLTFYEASVTPEVTEEVWARGQADPPALDILLAVDAADRPVGLLHAFRHQNTWSIAPVCYLEDLFVDPEVRGGGVGRALIEALAEQGRAEGWLRIYWQTAADNVRAQRLYDLVAKRTSWVRYNLDL